MHPILFEIGEFPIGTYALMAMLGLAAGLALFAWLAARDGHDRIAFVEIGLWAFIIGLFSSKIFGAIVDFDSANPWRSIMAVLRFGGYYYIGFIATLGYAAVAFRRMGVSLPRGLDYAAPATALAHGIGRIGCLLAGCCWGSACDLPWAVTFTSVKAHELTGVPLNVAIHPTQVYEALAELLIAGFLTWKAIARPWKAGSTFLAYIALYGAVRFAIEFVRADPRGMFLGHPTSKPLALASAVAAVVLLVLMAMRRRTPTPSGTAGDMTATVPRGASAEISATHPRTPHGKKRR